MGRGAHGNCWYSPLRHNRLYTLRVEVLKDPLLIRYFVVQVAIFTILLPTKIVVNLCCAYCTIVKFVVLAIDMNSITLRRKCNEHQHCNVIMLSADRALNLQVW
jgi:hypothetical protein